MSATSHQHTSSHENILKLCTSISDTSKYSSHVKCQHRRPARKNNEKYSRNKWMLQKKEKRSWNGNVTLCFTIELKNVFRIKRSFAGTGQLVTLYAELSNLVCWKRENWVIGQHWDAFYFLNCICVVSENTRQNLIPILTLGFKNYCVIITLLTTAV